MEDKVTDGELEGLVLASIQDLGVSTVDEILQYLKDSGIEGKTEITVDRVQKHTEKWRGRNAVAVTYVNNALHYKIKDVPAWFNSLRMPDLIQGQLKGLKDILEKIKKWTGPNVYHDYRKYKVTIETLDPILGGYPSGEERKLILRRNRDNEPIVALNQLRAWHRDNFPLAGIPKYVHRHIAFTDAIGEFEPIWIKQIRVKEGFSDYEAVPGGTKLEYTMKVPNKGRVSVSIDQFIALYHETVDSSIRGVGANPFVFGGRFKLLEIVEVPDTRADQGRD